MLRLLSLLTVLGRQTTSRFRQQVSIYLAGSTILLILVGALAVLDTERGVPDSNIREFPDALWWAVVTITTVGYGDYYPVTLEGRFIAIGLMITGISALGVITASLASWFIERVAAETPKEQASGSDMNRTPESAAPGISANIITDTPMGTPEEMRALIQEVRALRAEVSQFRHARYDSDTP